MKKIIKKIGKFFIVLRFKDNEVLKRISLIVDNDNIAKEHLNSVLWKTRENFANTHMVLLTFEQRKRYIGDEFKDEVEIIYPNEKIWIKRYRIAIEMFKLRNRNFDFIILTSLHITPIIVAIFFTRAQVWLFNQWNQWWSLRQRTVGDVFKFPLALIWFVFIGIRNSLIFLYLLFSVGLFWLRRFLPFRKA